MELAQRYLAEGYLRKAIEVRRQAKAWNPDRVELWLALGNTYLADEHDAAAVGEYREVLKAAPDLQDKREQLAKAEGGFTAARKTGKLVLALPGMQSAKDHK